MMSDLKQAIEILKTNNLFLTGGAGVGKSYTTLSIINHYERVNKSVVKLGSTGVSAVNLGGMTIHSFFIFGIADNAEALLLQDKKNKSRIKELKKILSLTDLLVIDEISMVSSDLMDMIGFRLQECAFSGKVLLVGDFFQLPPVVKTMQKVDIFGSSLYAFESLSWERLELKVMEFSTMYRTQNLQFITILEKIRKGICDKSVVDYVLSLMSNPAPREPTYLYGRNDEANRTNVLKLAQISTKEYKLLSIVKINDKKLHEKKLENWKKALPIEEELRLKIGASVIFTVNKWGKYLNGQRGVIHSIEEDAIIVALENEFVRVERAEFFLSEFGVEKGEVVNVDLASLKQFPLKLAYAITIHKSQGMSIEHLVCNIDNIFTTSQFYVAISRATNPLTLLIEFNKKRDIASHLTNIIRVDSRVANYYNTLAR